MTFYITTRPARHSQRWQEADVLPLNIHEDDDAYTLTAPVPGLQAEDLTIQIVDDVVSIEGEYKTQDGDYLVREFPYGRFRRALRLPVALDSAHAEAALELGLLTLRIPKAEAARPKMIKVNAR